MLMLCLVWFSWILRILFLAIEVEQGHFSSIGSLFVCSRAGTRRACVSFFSLGEWDTCNLEWESMAGIRIISWFVFECSILQPLTWCSSLIFYFALVSKIWFAIGFGPGLPGLQLVIGPGVGCGVGFGFGYGYGMGRGRGIAYQGNLPGRLPSE